jgi:hypothetical protein
MGSMPEVAEAGEDHGHAGGGDDFLITNRATGLDASGGTGHRRQLSGHVSNQGGNQGCLQTAVGGGAHVE